MDALRVVFARGTGEGFMFRADCGCSEGELQEER